MTGQTFAVCVFCASSSAIDPRYLELANAVGTAIGARGWTLVSGGGSVSMMGAVARAARSAGGHTIGVIPQALVDLEVADHDADELVVTTSMRERKAVMDARSQATLALPGGIGTLEELMEMWTSSYLGLHGKPVAVLDPWDDFALLRQQVSRWRETGFVSQRAVAHVHWDSDIDSALDYLDAPHASPGTVAHDRTS